jgi:hypothetical protein
VSRLSVRSRLFHLGVFRASKWFLDFSRGSHALSVTAPLPLRRFHGFKRAVFSIGYISSHVAIGSAINEIAERPWFR